MIHWFGLRKELKCPLHFISLVRICFNFQELAKVVSIVVPIRGINLICSTSILSHLNSIIPINIVILGIDVLITLYKSKLCKIFSISLFTNYPRD